MTKEVLPEYYKVKALSQSVLKLVSKSPADAKAALDKGFSKPTPAMQKGICLHAQVLENKIIYASVPPRASKEQKAEISLANPGKILLSASDALEVQGMAESLLSNPDCADILALDGGVEVDCFWTEDGIDFKARLDKIICIGVPDIKSTQDATIGGFMSSIYKYGYHVQAAMYLRACERMDFDVPESFFFLAVESAFPHYSAVYELDKAALLEGQLELDRLIALWKECVKNNYWPAYTRGIKTISIPRYGFRHTIQGV
jgi:exodeoxyribonuclease VIII